MLHTHRNFCHGVRRTSHSREGAGDASRGTLCSQCPPRCFPIWKSERKRETAERQRRAASLSRPGDGAGEPTEFLRRVPEAVVPKGGRGGPLSSCRGGEVARQVRGRLRTRATELALATRSFSSSSFFWAPSRSTHAARVMLLVSYSSRSISRSWTSIWSTSWSSLMYWITFQITSSRLSFFSRGFLVLAAGRRCRSLSR